MVIWTPLGWKKFPADFSGKGVERGKMRQLPPTTKELLGQDYRVDYVDHTIRACDVGLNNFGAVNHQPTHAVR